MSLQHWRDDHIKFKVCNITDNGTLPRLDSNVFHESSPRLRLAECEFRVQIVGRSAESKSRTFTVTRYRRISARNGYVVEQAAGNSPAGEKSRASSYPYYCHKRIFKVHNDGKLNIIDL